MKDMYWDDFINTCTFHFWTSHVCCKDHIAQSQ